MSVAEPVHPLVGDLVLGRHGAEGTPGITLDAPARDVVQLLARRGQKISAMPGPGRSAATDFGTAIWLQPGVWAVVAPRGPAGALAGRLAEEFGDRAAVVDQSHGRTVIGMPPSGRIVIRTIGRMRWSGSGVRCAPRTSVARMMVASIIANAMPMQMRGPKPNGMNCVR